ncbi:ATP-dependent Clp protease adapter ClpS [Paenalcaligenes niemegkensis]|uniref:ATP-dependent Clp protease adapter ClpS n=1 Tax=Paenalcaligenes niemegkensis TaxID=2895469 RepID=UPI001EE7DED8|nr:ATP-dependent Clp protease adapter ClpS [Paenalcaligenes niemegkensis]MCQ9616613.1 ATP-dependent Clp protease adapter ClpS [Paenalcaligenes niemegkensis]
MAIQLANQKDTVVERETTRLAPPPMYQVVLLNDDYTPMEFVVAVLQRVFNKTELEAERIMLKVHHEGRGICGIFPRDIAATRVEIVRQLAVAREHPLQCIMEPAPES